MTEETGRARKLNVLVDADLTSWEAWNQFANDFVDAAGCRLVHIDDGGITGPGIPGLCLRLNAPALASPKRMQRRCRRGYARDRSAIRRLSGAGRS